MRSCCTVVRWLLVAALVPWVAAYAQVPTHYASVALSQAQEARYIALLPGLRCMQCQNESLASSEAPLAKDMRHKIRLLLVAGDSDAQIKQYFVDRYGQYVLYKPRFEPLTWLLWLGPFALLLVALFTAWWWVHRTPAIAVAAPDRAALRKLLDEER
ncbi:MAG TPA: cytochrome c-type biogenesis protein [Nevskiaceae bacterium]|nr:cytochrome c-type biogenesis protein [Nevskiaceae bacterium]